MRMQNLWQSLWVISNEKNKNYKIKDKKILICLKAKNHMDNIINNMFDVDIFL